MPQEHHKKPQRHFLTHGKLVVILNCTEHHNVILIMGKTTENQRC